MNASPQNNPIDSIDSVELAAEVWHSRNYQHYQFTAILHCYCLPETRSPRLITVNKGKIDFVKLATSQKADRNTPHRLNKTINDWFDLLRDIKQKSEAKDSSDSIESPFNRTTTFKAEFSATTGFPIKISIDPHPRMADDEYTVIFKDFEEIK